MEVLNHIWQVVWRMYFIFCTAYVTLRIYGTIRDDREEKRTGKRVKRFDIFPR